MSLDTDDFCNTAFLTDMTVRAAVTSSLGHRQTLCACYCHQFSGTQTDSVRATVTSSLGHRQVSVRAAVTSSLGHRQALCACCCHQFSGTQTNTLCVLLSPVLWDTDRLSVRAAVTSSLGHSQTLCACYCHQFSGTQTDSLCVLLSPVVWDISKSYVHCEKNILSQLAVPCFIHHMRSRWKHAVSCSKCRCERFFVTTLCLDKV